MCLGGFPQNWCQAPLFKGVSVLFFSIYCCLVLLFLLSVNTCLLDFVRHVQLFMEKLIWG